MPLAVLTCCLVATLGCDKDERPYELQVRDLHNPDFEEVYKVGMNEEFELGDSGYSARIVRFVPDFRIDLETKEVTSASEEMNNPAVLLEVLKDGEKVAEQWAFRQSMPHMGGSTTFTFTLLTIKGEAGTESMEPGEASRKAATEPAGQKADSTAGDTGGS